MMKFLMFGIMFFVFSAIFGMFLPGLFKIIAFVPLSMSLMCFFIAGIQEKIRSAESQTEEKRKAALLKASSELKLSRVPKDINELMSVASSMGKESEAFSAYENEMKK
ncbi:MAG: hypothetical protein HZB68_02690 [Candidatus Aenigmarchaeota archaeon]|nr:hypothetical protein [Candidatus Aenigmarchaeota archaeon]